MKLKQILSEIEYNSVIGNGEVEIKGIAIDSKQVQRGQVFIALRGINTDGNDYIAEAIMRGAVAVVSEVTIADLPVTLVVVKDARSSLAKICSAYYCHPEKSLKFIGVTGTNGKTTVTHLIKGILDKNGYKTGLIGTLGAYYGDNYRETSLTTPDPIELFSTLSDMVSAGVTHVIMEVSAHASRLKKLDGITFDIGIFTNLTQDHLDYFETIENYKQAKLEFLNLKKCKQIVTNVDDETGKEIALSIQSISYGIDNPSDVFAINIEESKKVLVKAFQVGVFSRVENATRVAELNNGIVVKEDDMYRVYIGILNNDKAVVNLSKFYDMYDINYYIRDIYVNGSVLESVRDLEQEIIKCNTDCTDIMLNILTRYQDSL
jgi:UDP-N-acetylmuramoyl-L-alanyl-D-glutamate--2,6-diaminopimelate ligase